MPEALTEPHAPSSSGSTEVARQLDERGDTRLGSLARRCPGNGAGANLALEPGTTPPEAEMATSTVADITEFFQLIKGGGA